MMEPLFTQVVRAWETSMATSIRTRGGIILLVMLCGCGGGGGGTSSGGGAPPPPTNQSPGGFWTTQYTITSGANNGDMVQAKALVTENGDFFFAGINTTNGCADVGFGQASVTGSSISGTTEIAIVTFTTVPGVTVTCAYPDGSTSGTGTISGTLTQRSSMTLTDSGTTSAGLVLPAEPLTWT